MPKFTSEFVGLDLEATDLSPERGGIIEIGAVRWKNGKEVAEFQTFIDPGTPIPPIITSITNIRDQDVHGQPKFEDVKDDLKKFIGDAPIVGHNIQFDITFLRSQGLPLDNQLFDTWKIATLMLPKASSHSLEALAQDLQLNHPEAHRALHDARVGAELLMYLADKVAELDPITSGRILDVLSRNEYSLKSFFEEVLAGAKAQAATNIVPGWENVPDVIHPHSVHVGERGSGRMSDKQGDTLDVTDIKELFQKAVSPVVPAFEMRTGQVSLAKRVLEQLSEKGIGLIEAGTGLGRREAAVFGAALAKKSPVFYAVAGQHELEAVLPRAESISTFLKKELAVLDRPSNYVFIPALQDVLERDDLQESQTHLAIKMLIWITQTKTGHLKELAITWEERSILEEVSCESHTCSVQPEPELCSFCRAVEHAQSAHVVVLTHGSLLWLGSLEKPLLKPAGLVVDDADRLEESTVKFFGKLVHQERVERLLERVNDVAPDTETATIKNKLTLLAGLVGVFLDHQALESEWSGYRTISISRALENDPEYGRIKTSIAALRASFIELAKQVKDTALARELTAMADTLELFTREEHPNGVITISLNAGQKAVFKFEPVTAAAYVAEHILSATSVVILGPRLSVGQEFEFIRGRLGIPSRVNELLIPGPTPLEERTKVITITDHPESTEKRWPKDTAQVIAQTAQKVGGRVMVVFNGRGQALAVHPELEKLLAGTKIKLITQGLSGGRGKTTKTLQRHPDAVLLTSHLFMQGRKFDHGFKAIIIAKFPFEVPDERYKAMRAKDSQSGFMTFDLPRVALKVREHFDRLLVGPRDRGVFVIIDPKVQKEYAALVLKTLPGVPQVGVATKDLDEQLSLFAKDK